jgi:hypothetical protein
MAITDADIKRASDSFRGRLDAKLVLAAEMMRTEIAAGAPVGRGEQVDMGTKKGTSKRLGGNLKSLLTRRRIGFCHQRVNSGADYSAHVEFGTAPHEIKPKSKKALAFVSGGQKVVVKSVQHPGTRPNPFMRNGMRLAIPKIKSTLGLS